MDRKTRDDTLLEFGLLLIVTGLFVGVFVASLLIVVSRESAVASSFPLMLVSAGALSCLLALVVFLIRRLRWFIAYR